MPDRELGRRPRTADRLPNHDVEVDNIAPDIEEPSAHRPFRYRADVAPRSPDRQIVAALGTVADDTSSADARSALRAAFRNLER